jgi:D-3-phosphoglycerate dehydrogenase / 2-oxoglutarate reductase
VRGGVPVTQELIQRNKRLKLILSAGIGVDNIDVNFARKENILVANCPFASAVSTAEHSVALMLAAIKSIPQANVDMKKGVWDRTSHITNQFSDKNIGVIGLGRIGSHAAALYKALGFNVMAYDPYLHNYHFQKLNIKIAKDLDEIFDFANYISMHVAKTNETEGLIDEERILKLNKPNGIVNTCRGGVISEKVLIKLLKDKQLGFYAADVFEKEPGPNPELMALDNVIATPHIAANTYEAQEQIADDAIAQLNEVFQDNITPRFAL